MTARPEPGSHGRAVMQWLDAEFDALGIAPVTWARAHGITATNFGKWRDGVSDPSLTSLEEIAIALGRRPLALLVAARYIDPAEIEGGDPTHAAPPSVVDAINRDPALTPKERRILQAALDLAREDDESPAPRRRRRV